MISVYRKQTHIRMMAVFTGLFFLNMSFFMIEVNALKLQKNKLLFENIVKLLNGSGQEEEKDVFGDTGSSESPEMNEVDLFLCSSLNLHNTLFLIEEMSVGTFYADIPTPEYYEIVQQPPEA